MNPTEKSTSERTDQAPSSKVTALEKLLIILSAIYLTYPLFTVLLVFVITEQINTSDNPLAGSGDIPLHLFIITTYAILATFSGLAALILDIVYLRKFHPTGKRKKLVIISIASICVCAIMLNLVTPLINTLYV